MLIGIDHYKDKVAEVSSHGWGCADLRDTQKRWTYADFSYTTIEKGGRSWRRPATGQADEGKGYGVLRFASPSRTAGQPRLADDQAIAAGRAGESARSDPNIVRSRRVIARLCVCLVELPQPQRADFFTAALERMHRATVAGYCREAIRYAAAPPRTAVRTSGERSQAGHRYRPGRGG
jgi:hypothetical protein